ncbi:MAG: hypothetical protein HN774_12965 [Bacteroidetes Order II. Incertae sedis bacterium]|jgi:hypothetical protein|nr:hypothetical protein [Bacteroidetes Order II. bacterium]
METWYRQFLLILAGIVYLMTPVELLLSNHMEGFIQWMPFGACLLGLLGIVYFHLSPSVTSLKVFRSVMIVSVLTSLFGMYEHLEHNMAFELEIRPNAIWTDVILEAITGASPMLSPGILILAGVIGLASAYKWKPSP